MIVAAVLAVPLQVLALILAPAATLLAVVPLAVVLPTLAWLDRVEPEPRGARIHALLWGATVAVVISAIVNSLVAVGAGEDVAAVASAPLVEEFTKGLGVWWAVRRRELDSVIDGLVYAGWVAAGFAAAENVQYFVMAAGDGSLVATFVLRGIATPFAHPLFTAWIGVAIGLAVSRGRPRLAAAIPGYLAAVALHAAWNGSLVASSNGAGLLLLAIAVFVAIFVTTVLMVVRLRQRERRRILATIPVLAERYGIPVEQHAVLADWSTRHRVRRQLARADRRRFDDLYATLARLVMLHDRPGGIDPVTEARLLERLRSTGPKPG